MTWTDHLYEAGMEGTGVQGSGCLETAERQDGFEAETEKTLVA